MIFQRKMVHAPRAKHSGKPRVVTFGWLGFGGIPVSPFFNASIIARRIEPVPEPTALAIFGLGLLGLGVMRRRRTGGSL